METNADSIEDRPAHRYPIAIVGAGALGLTFAARLAPWMRVALVARTATQAAALRADVQVGERKFCLDAYTPEQPPRADWVIVLVKAYDTEAAARSAVAMQPRGVLSLQNGLLDAELRRYCVPLLAGQGVTTQGAWRDGDRVTPVGVGETLLPSGFEPLAGLLAQTGLNARIEPAIVAARMEKLLINLALNPLTAAYRVPNGAVLEAPLWGEVQKLVGEAWPVMRAEGLVLGEAEALAKVRTVAAATAANRSSMLQDVLAGRRTEIDHITGAFVKLAEQHGAEVPAHRALLTQIKTLGTPTG